MQNVITFYVQNFDLALAWYTRFFGREPQYADESCALFKADGFKLVLQNQTVLKACEYWRQTHGQTRTLLPVYCDREFKEITAQNAVQKIQQAIMESRFLTEREPH